MENQSQPQRVRRPRRKGPTESTVQPPVKQLVPQDKQPLPMAEPPAQNLVVASDSLAESKLLKMIDILHSAKTGDGDYVQTYTEMPDYCEEWNMKNVYSSKWNMKTMYSSLCVDQKLISITPYKFVSLFQTPQDVAALKEKLVESTEETPMFRATMAVDIPVQSLLELLGYEISNILSKSIGQAYLDLLELGLSSEEAKAALLRTLHR